MAFINLYFTVLTIDDDVYEWDQVIDHSYGNISLVSKADNTTLVYVKPDITFMVTRAYGKDVGFFLGLYILNGDGLSKQSKGVIGELLTLVMYIIIVYCLKRILKRF